MSTSILESASGWQSGMSSLVFLPAMMPAMRAAPSTSPFLASPLSTRSSVVGAITTRPSATATRSVASFADTSTMRASPLWPRWVSLLATGLLRRALKALRPAEQAARRGLHVGLAHQALADQEGAHPDARKCIEIGGGEDPALRYGDALLRNLWRKALAGRKRDIESAQVTVVDTDEARAQLERAFQLGVVVH